MENTIPDDWSGNLSTLSLGYDWQRGKLVYGVTLAVSNGDLVAMPAAFQGDSSKVMTIDKLKTFRGRVGYALGKILVYATAGVAKSHSQASISGRSGIIVVADDLTGWTAGIGVERFVSDKITLSAEYLHTDLGRMELHRIFATQSYTDIRFGLLQLGVNYRW